MKLEAKDLRIIKPKGKEVAKIKRQPIYIVLDNVLDTYNVGAIFRLADAVAAEKIYLCGQTLTPDDKKEGHKIHKASVGTWRWVPWQYASTAVEAITKLKAPARGEARQGRQSSKLKAICIEQYEKSIPYTKMRVEFPTVLVVGNETYGVSKNVLDQADEIVEIPLWGVNKSLNVMVSLAIVLYEVMRKKVGE